MTVYNVLEKLLNWICTHLSIFFWGLFVNSQSSNPLYEDVGSSLGIFSQIYLVTKNKYNFSTIPLYFILCNENKIFEILLFSSLFWQLKTFKIAFFLNKISLVKKTLIYTHPCNCHQCNTCATMGFVECKALEWGDIKVWYNMSLQCCS